ncbi:insulinase family protein [Streptomyces sp. ISL-43]|uniref:M16 family metallopeptidase n=1 Tax=Streptomyces sp. ISL-43 TaxID=2819183 RepID=UPI001BE8FA75|nr:pitrilysin family protein [Streptomyces sp. ISL-43]MBT2450993.1 insulinase family protein [Streptomyces sp. ISL-43]
MSDPVGHTLANGLRVVVSRDASTPVAAVCLRYAAGSRDEPTGRTGLAHLFEHLMFQGSTNVAAGGHSAAVEEAGGFTNASTGFERTAFFSAVPAAHLELVLWLEADRMGGLLDAFTPHALDTQREVVLNERRERYDNVPYGTGWEQLVAMSFGPGHPYRDLPAGSPHDLAAVTPADCHAFFRRHYTPDQAILSVVGDVAPDRVIAQAQRHFGHIPPSPAEARDGHFAGSSRLPGRPKPGLPVETRRRSAQAVPGPALMAAYQLPPSGGRDCDAADLALTLLGGMSSSALHHRLVRTDQLAHSARFSLMPLHGAPSLGRLHVRTVPGAGPAEVEAVIGEEILRFTEKGVTEEALRGAKALIRRDWYDRLATPVGRAEELCAHEAESGSAVTLGTRLDQAMDISAEEVRQAAARWLSPERACVLTYENQHPAGASAGSATGTRGAAV